LNTVFEQGKVTALVGASGAGKSTIVNLLLGLYEPSGGRILVDGIPLSDYNLDSWRRRLGFVSQDPFVIHGTLADNITFGRDGFSEQDVVAAAVQANADAFIRELPEGYQTLVGERGMKLSGGQQQRLCIARALLANPSLLLLDEATSSLDSITERAIQETIREISENRTVIQIAHRASTVARADHIVVLHEGRIVEMGSHMDLLRNDGEYAKLFVTPAGN
jgi:ABC-type multidrug transport system fused ATPase/permease subunit